MKFGELLKYVGTYLVLGRFWKNSVDVRMLEKLRKDPGKYFAVILGRLGKILYYSGEVSVVVVVENGKEISETVRRNF